MSKYEIEKESDEILSMILNEFNLIVKTKDCKEIAIPRLQLIQFLDKNRNVPRAMQIDFPKWRG